jgi:ABC-2 type transport system permease protein
MTPAPATPAPSLGLAVLTLWQRELVQFTRHRSRVLGALGTPLVFWLLIGSGIGTSFRHGAAPAGMTYLEYFFPGTVLLIVLFTSIFCMMSVIEDRHQGFLLSVLVAPLPRFTLVLGKILGGATLAAAQGLLFVLLAPAAGIGLGPAQFALIGAVLFLVALALTGLGFLVAWKLDSVQGFHAVVNLFLIPMWLLSGALFPSSGAAGWVQWSMKLNPLTYGLAALRRLFYWDAAGPGGEPTMAVALTVTAAFAFATALASFLIAERPVGSDWG